MNDLWHCVDVKLDHQCWPWKGALNSSGYGGHRRIYEKIYGPIPDKQVVMHTCNNRACCNPYHLTLGTQSDNLLFSTLCGRKNNAQTSTTMRAKRPGKGLYYDRRSDCYYIVFKVFGRPLYIGTVKEKTLAEVLAKAALESADKLIRTRENITYEDIKEYFKCGVSFLSTQS